MRSFYFRPFNVKWSIFTDIETMDYLEREYIWNPVMFSSCKRKRALTWARTDEFQPVTSNHALIDQSLSGPELHVRKCFIDYYTKTHIQDFTQGFLWNRYEIYFMEEVFSGFSSNVLCLNPLAELPDEHTALFTCTRHRARKSYQNLDTVLEAESCSFLSKLLRGAWSR